LTTAQRPCRGLVDEEDWSGPLGTTDVFTTVNDQCEALLLFSPRRPTSSSKSRRCRRKGPFVLSGVNHRSTAMPGTQNEWLVLFCCCWKPFCWSRKILLPPLADIRTAVPCGRWRKQYVAFMMEFSGCVEKRRTLSYFVCSAFPALAAFRWDQPHRRVMLHVHQTCSNGVATLRRHGTVPMLARPREPRPIARLPNLIQPNVPDGRSRGNYSNLDDLVWEWKGFSQKVKWHERNLLHPRAIVFVNTYYPV
jgi:hypothetical protein